MTDVAGLLMRMRIADGQTSAQCAVWAVCLPRDRTS